MEKMLMTAMTASISEVMETMFFMPVEFAEAPDPVRVTLLKKQPNKACRLEFSGDFSGNVSLLIPLGLLAEMTENFTGEPKESLGDEFLEGTLTEAVNMICGNALRKITASKPFALGIPGLIAGEQFPEAAGILIVETPEAELAVNITFT